MIALGALCAWMIGCSEVSTEGFELIELETVDGQQDFQGPAQSRAGRIPDSESKVQLLIAARTLRGPVFGRSVILLLEHSAEGAMGLIINRPTDLSLQEALPATRQWANRGDRVFLGGPVQTQLIAFLMRADTDPPKSKRVLADVYVFGDHEALVEVLEGQLSNNRFRAYLGYAGWGPGQLDAEIARGDWHLTPAQPDAIFGDSEESLWERLVFEHEGTQVRASNPLEELAVPREGSPEISRLATIVEHPLVRL